MNDFEFGVVVGMIVLLGVDLISTFIRAYIDMKSGVCPYCGMSYHSVVRLLNKLNYRKFKLG